ncbi:hypothetical protein ACB092_02G194200 [Castanea dentata]
MAQSKSIAAFLFLVIIFSQQIQSIEGRHLREGKKSNKSQTLQTQTKIYETETIKHDEEITSESPPAAPTTVNVSQPPPSPNRGVDDFRPTTPGHSPGVGHSIQN